MRTAAVSLLLTFALSSAGLCAQVEKKDSRRTQAAPPPIVRFDIRQALDASAQVLLDVIRPGYNPIPLAVLNKARCAVFINSKGAENAWGIASCRLTPNTWTPPAFVSFHDDNRAEASRQRELLVLLMSERAV